MKPASLIASIFIGLVALGHLIRFILHTQILIGGHAIPVWLSAPAFLLLAALAVCLVRELRGSSAK
ncbi:MAG TPA: hypothetical protein VFF76_03980 [Holophagaceae bacterium]|jgi:hypothetical protein|nr:hypothetical protein [Holophagaceae bacterium]